ncbi:Capn15, partial [Symbiodinium necroappetens]
MLAPAIDLESDTEVQRHSELLPELASRSGAECKTAVPPTRRWGRCFSGTTPGTATAQRSCDPGPSVCTVCGDDAVTNKDLQRARDDWHKLLASAQAPYEDPEFPAEPKSICGREEESLKSPNEPPQCRCGQASRKSEVQKDGPTKGRLYWHCEKRRCGFFAWADSDHRRREKIWWQRFPEFMIVSDFGFRAEDLRQGGVGDCWFMSALAVVAERPDLVLRLFGDTARNQAGCYQVNLFLDGEWR